MAKRHIAPILPYDPSDERMYGSYHGLSEVAKNGNEIEEEYCWDHLPPVAGVMIGREAWQRPWMLATVDTGWCLIAHKIHVCRVHACSYLCVRERKCARLSERDTQTCLGCWHGTRGQHDAPIFKSKSYVCARKMTEILRVYMYKTWQHTMHLA
jgi:tRNA-dihydrouridine synthase